MATAAVTVAATWRTRFRYVVLASAAVVVLGVAASRLYLDAHYPADVLTGWCVGLASVALAWSGLNVWTRRAEPGCRTLGSERGFSFDSGRELVLKGFSGPILVFELSPREH
jgi:membrane-associated phospholipid phosphatase